MKYMILVCANIEIRHDVVESIVVLGVDRDDIEDDGTEAQYDGLGDYQRFNIQFARKRDCIRFARKIFASKIQGILKTLAGYSEMPWYPVNDVYFAF